MLAVPDDRWGELKRVTGWWPWWLKGREAKYKEIVRKNWKIAGEAKRMLTAYYEGCQW